MISILRVLNFRVHEDYLLELSKGVNIIVGPNASGKTSLIEAVYIALQGTSFKGSDNNTIQFGKEWSRIDLNSEKTKRVVKLSYTNSKLQKIFSVDSNESKRLKQIDKYPVVLFDPSALSMISGSPTKRREYLDKTLSQIDPVYKQNLSKYKKVLLQRNKLLKQQTTKDQIFAWDIQLVEAATYIIEQREQFVTTIQKNIHTAYSGVVGGGDHKIKIKYNNTVVSGPSFKSEFAIFLNNNFYKDSVLGTTSVGPHRDDFYITLNYNPAQISASRGECRSLVIALKIIEIDLITEYYKKEPLLLFDDVFSELDGSRRKALTRLLNKHQAVVTTTDADVAIGLSKESKIIPI